MGDEGGGVAQAVRGLTSAVPKHGIRPVFISLGRGDFATELEARGEQVLILGDFRLPVLQGRTPSKLAAILPLLRATAMALPSLRAALARSRAQAVHFLWPHMMLLVGRASKYAGVPCFWEMPNVMGSYRLGANRRIVQQLLRRYRIIPLANSRASAASLGSRPVRPTPLYLGADTNRFFPGLPGSVTRADLGIPPGSPVIEISASLAAEKGQHIVLEAIAAFRGEDAPHLLLVGGGEGAFGERLRRQAEQLGLKGRLHLVGQVRDPERFWEIADIAASATTVPESFGLSVVEAMLCAKPVLAHALGGPAETVVDGVTGWHVREPTVGAFRAGIERALSERGKWAEMGAAGRERALQHFSLPVQAKRYAEVVREKAPEVEKPRVAMVQDGARLHYALPVALKRAGMLSALYTDWYYSGGAGTAVSNLAAAALYPSEARRMKLRSAAELAGVPVFHGGVLGLRTLAVQRDGRPRSRRAYGNLIREMLHRLAALGPLSRPAMGRSVVFAFSHMFIPTPEINLRLKDLGHILLFDQPLVWAAEVQRQRQRAEADFPGWEPPGRGDDGWAAKEQALVPVADHWTCPAAYTRDTLVEMGVAPERITVLPYPADTSGYPFTDRAGRSRPIKVGFVGAVNLRKGAPWFFEAAKRCDPALVEFVMVGPVLLTHHGKTMLSKRAKLVGPLPRADVLRWLRTFDIFFFPSTCEGSAGAVMEAMATGLPVITSPNSGSVVRHGADGYVGPYDGPEQYAAWITELALDEEKRLTMGRSAHARACAFDIDYYSREIAALVRQLVGCAPPGA
jgi:glycosyltransferase involved in cell wall biosynthesis